MSNSEAVIRAQKRKKQFAVDKFGGKCTICGYNKCLGALEFHHIETKEEAPSYIIHRWSWKKAKKELEKCVLLCCRCHREIHYKCIDLDLRNYVLPWIDKECPSCGDVFQTKNEDQKFCSQQCSQFSQRKTNRPSSKELEQLISENSFVKLGKMYNVSDNAVRKWAKGYGII